MTGNRRPRHNLPAGQGCRVARKIRNESARLAGGAKTVLALAGQRRGRDPAAVWRRSGSGRADAAMYARAMDLSEFPLLNRPALMLLMLKTAADGPATLADSRLRLGMELSRIHERPDVPEAVIAAELEEVRKHLLAAGLLEPGDGDAVHLTRRGRKVLAEHPLGVDETVLAGFPEYRAFLRNFARRRTVDDPRLSRYEEGYAARLAGLALSENPYPPDSIDHLAWENGWSEGEESDRGRRG